jgi:ElaB/YqjD/DUF883 family membrane-anchored ribosome-binding protein
MSVDQVKQFTDGLQILTEDFKTDSKELTDTYATEVKESAAKFEEIYPQLKDSAQQFESASHDYAQSMIARADEYVAAVDELYQEVYGSNKK